MEPVSKKTKLTDHFRKVLKPRDTNIIGANNNNNNVKQHLKLSQEPGTSSQTQPLANGHKESRSSRENLQLDQLPRKLAHQQKQSPKKVEVITIEDDEAEDDEATEIDDTYANEENRRPLRPIQRQPQGAQTQQHSQQQIQSNSENQSQSQCQSQTAEEEQSRLVSKSELAEARDRIFNYDESVLDNVHWEPHYACDSFDYDRKQELKFRLNLSEIEIKTAIRAELIDWLVALQVRFSLDHEPLYMAVKLADLYLMQTSVPDDKLVLLYLTTIFIAAKFDERQTYITMPMLIKQAKEKFGIRYTMRNIVELEVDLLTTLDFNLRFPLSYGFLRRFARCTRTDMRTINLARYILETSLMDYEMIETLESEIAAGSLLLAHEMLHHTKAWNATARHYTGYEERDLFPLIIRLNKMLLKFSRKKTAIRRKYSHEMFMEVAKIPPILPELLLLMTSDQQPR